MIISKLPNESLSGFIPSYNVNAFFFKMNNFLKDYYTADKKQAGNIIQHYCKAYNINQKLIIATLQKEQGLIEDLGNPRLTVPDIKLLDGATGCGLLDGGEVLTKYLGFENQISGACSTYRHWYNAWKPAMRNVVYDNPEKWVEAGNEITYSFLKYTPRLSALKLIEDVYKRYFL